MITKNAITLNIIVIYLLSFSITCSVFGQEKIDNAAILYYQAFLISPDEDTISEEFKSFGYGLIDSTPELLKLMIVTNENTIRLIARATEIQECNWLIDNININTFSDIKSQISFRIPTITALIGADARNCAINGDYIAAFDKCRTIIRFSKHLDILGFGIAQSAHTNTKAFRCIGKILDIMPSDEDTLQYLKKLLEEENKNTQQLFESTMNNEINVILWQISYIDIKEAIKDQPIKDEKYENYRKELLAMDNKDIIEIINKYLKNSLNSVLETIQNENSYTQTYIKIQKLEEIFEQQAENNPAITYGIKPAIAGITQSFGLLYALDMSYISRFNSLKVATEIYLVKARTGQLPKELPEGLAKDPYSGQDFEYILTDAGFMLRCREKNAQINDFVEFEFKVK